MSGEAVSTSEIDVLRAIADLLNAKRSAAVLAHYPTLRIQTNNLRDALIAGIQSVDALLDELTENLRRDENVTPEFRAMDAAAAAYRTIAPVLVRNLHRTADFLLSEARALPAVDVDRVSETTPSFSDFVKLGAAVRGFLDALVQSAYQLVTFDGLQLNYKFLQSLLSFAAVAPASLHANIVSSEVQAALDAYMALTRKERKNSSFTKAAHEQFPQRLEIAAQVVGLSQWRRRNIELLFSFCSDFVHSGYVSVLAIGEPAPGFVLGGPGDAFTPSAENFAELKQRLLAECAGAYADLLLPALHQAMDHMLTGGIPPIWAEELDAAATRIGDLRAILHRQLVEPIRRGMLASNAVVEIQCMCGSRVELAPPHHEWDRYCSTCGSRFTLHEVDDEVDYVISAAGVGDVLGGDATKIAELDAPLRDKLHRIAAKHAPNDPEGQVSFVPITDLERCDEATLAVPSLISSAPKDSDRKRCSLMAFVAAKSLERCPTVRIACNCGADVDYPTADRTNIVQCPKCRNRIGLLGVTGGGTGVPIRNPDGTSGVAPIQARDRFSRPSVAVSSPAAPS